LPWEQRRREYAGRPECLVDWECFRIAAKKLREHVKFAQSNIDENGQIESILIDPKYFMAAIERHFIDYLLSLRNPKEKIKRYNFSKIAKAKWDYEGKGTIIGLNSDGII